MAGRTAEPLANPTDRWLATVEGMPPLEGPAGVAERLLLLLHYGINWNDGWVARYRQTYWEEILVDRVVVATYRNGTLRRWWSDLAAELRSAPRTPAERREVEQLLRSDDQPVLEVLREELEALVLRTRITTESVRASRSAKKSEDPA